MMDPETCYDVMHDLFDAERYDEAHEQACQLLEYLRWGWYLPRNGISRVELIRRCDVIRIACIVDFS